MTAPGPREDVTLAIEVSNPSAGPRDGEHRQGADVIGPGVALARGGEVFSQEGLRTPGSRHDDDLMPAIDRMTRREGISPRDIGRVAVSIGPGGFTGLRVAIATAKAIGEAILTARGQRGEEGCCIGVPSARVVAANLLSGGDPQIAAPRGRPFAVALASKRETVWLTVFDAHALPAAGPPGEPGMLATAEDLAALHRRFGLGVLCADRFLPETLRAGALELGITLREPVFSAAACARVAATMPAVDPARLLPLYPREPEAVTKWRELHGSAHPPAKSSPLRPPS